MSLNVVHMAAALALLHVKTRAPEVCASGPHSKPGLPHSAGPDAEGGV